MTGISRYRKNKPKFKRPDSHKKKKLSSSWRRPRGLHNKARRQIKGKGPLVKIGYGSPRAVRGMHPSGCQEVLVHHPGELEGITEGQAVRIAHVGKRKHSLIVERARELGLKILNPRKESEREESEGEEVEEEVEEEETGE